MAKIDTASGLSLVRRLLPYARPHLRYAWALLALMALQAPLALVTPLILRRVIDDAVQRSSWESLSLWAVVLVLVTLITVLLGVGVGYLATLFQMKLIHSLRVVLYRHYQILPLSYYQDRETGYLMSRQLDDVGQLTGIMPQTLGAAAAGAFQAVGCLALMFFLEWRMTLGGLVLAIAALGFQVAISGGLRLRNREARDRWTDLKAVVHQSISGHYVVQSNAAEAGERRRFAKALHKSIRTNMRQAMYAIGTGGISTLLSRLLRPLIVLAGAYLIVQGQFTIGSLFAFHNYLSMMFKAVEQLTGLNPILQTSLTALERIWEVLDTESDIRSPEAGKRLGRLAGAVTFEDVHFSYQPGRPVLQGIDLRVEPRTLVALVGPSGAGKTTLVHLIPRFYDPTAGRVLVDGADLRTLELASLRRQVGVVPQDVFLFDRSVADNITYGRPRATLEEVRAAAKAANALEFIEGMANGFDTLIGERGVQLSGGQRQRIAIAREILRDPQILILDEATSSLDSESEALIQEALETLLAGRTSFVIAHRLSTVLRADVIVVLEDGCIVQQGRHNDLLAVDGLYARLFRSQFEKPLEAARAMPIESIA